MSIQNYGAMQSGDANSTSFGFYGFRGGLNVKASPQLLDDAELSEAVDGYLRPDGAFQMRNGMGAYGQPISANPLYLARFYQGVSGGSAVPETVKLLGQCDGMLYSIPAVGAATALGSVGGVNAQPMTTVRIQNSNDPNYTTGHLTDVTVICTGYGGPYVYDGTNPVYTPLGWAQATGALWCAIVNGILWFGGIPALPNQVFGAGDGIIASMETLPAYRNFIFSAPVVGLCAQGSGATAALVVGLNTGLSILYGTGPSTFFLQDLPFADGITSGLSMVSHFGTVYMLGHTAYYSFDAQSTPTTVSDKIEPWLLNDPFVPGFPMTNNWNLTWAKIYNNRLHLGYCSSSNQPNTILCYDLRLSAWTILRPKPGISSMTLLDAPGDPAPYVCYVGSSTTGQVYIWDYTTGNTSDPAYDGADPVTARVKTKYFKLGVPGTAKAIQRFYPEFFISGNFVTQVTVSTDYGLTTLLQTVAARVPLATVFFWDVGPWEQAVWGGPTALMPFGAPLSRIDLPGTQAESFAFGVTTSTALAPWIWVGGTGVFTQRGRT